MPELEYLVLADYVRQDAGMTHIMGAGIDTFFIPAERLPTAVPVGLVARITFSSRDVVGTEHEINLIFQGPGAEDLLTASQRIRTPPPAPGVPEHWRTAARNGTCSMRTPDLAAKSSPDKWLALPIPSHGDYRLQVAIDDDPRQSRSLDLRAIAPGPGQN